MTTISTLQEYGNQLAIIFDDGSIKLAYPAGGDFWISDDGITIRRFGQQLRITAPTYNGDAYQGNGTNIWYVNGGSLSGGGSSNGWEWPLNTSLWSISSPFGPRTSPYTGFHQGLDITGNGVTGTPVWAIHDGVCTTSSYNSNAGYFVAINHPDNTRSVYMHFPNLSNSPVVGANVTRGQVIGTVGATGDATGPHLHFETHDPVSAPINPIDYMRTRGHEFGEVQTS